MEKRGLSEPYNHSPGDFDYEVQCYGAYGLKLKTANSIVVNGSPLHCISSLHGRFAIPGVKNDHITGRNSISCDNIIHEHPVSKQDFVV
jgi:hypothetical protein